MISRYSWTLAPMTKKRDRLNFGTASCVTQGEHRFYMAPAIPSDVLARTCFVRSHEEVKVKGFQRVLDRKRAQGIADYIDEGLGTIPNSIVLSAQADAKLAYDPKERALFFDDIPNAFLILDGQYRVFGFALAKKKLCVPVSIYDNLSKAEESSLVFDINANQRGVPTDLLLDIKKRAERDIDEEMRIRSIFEKFENDYSALFLARLTSSAHAPGKITRSAFSCAVGPLIKLFALKSDDEVHKILRTYYQAIYDTIFAPNKIEDRFYQSNVFRAVSGFFPAVARRAKDRFGSSYSYDHFVDVLDPVSSNFKPARIREAKTAYKPLMGHLEESLASDFRL